MKQLECARNVICERSAEPWEEYETTEQADDSGRERDPHEVFRDIERVLGKGMSLVDACGRGNVGTYGREAGIGG